MRLEFRLSFLFQEIDRGSVVQAMELGNRQVKERSCETLRGGSAVYLFPDCSGSLIFHLPSFFHCQKGIRS